MLRALTLSFALCLTAAAHAQPYEPALLLQPALTSVENRAVDVLGFNTGMTRAEVLDAYAGLRGMELKTRETAITANMNGARVETTRYVDRLEGGYKADGMDEYFAFSFSGPASGNQLVWMTRAVRYETMSAPAAETVFASLASKYGEPTGRSQRATMTTMEWLYQGGRAHKANCLLSEKGYLLNMLSAYAEGQFLKCGDIQVLVRLFQNNSGNVTSIETTVTDNRKFHEAALADFQSLRDKAEEFITKNYAPAKVEL